MSDPKQFPAWILVKKSNETSQDSPNGEIWVSHCLEFDVVSQGYTAAEAYKACVEALTCVLEWDSEEGFDPQSRKSAPLEAYDDLHDLFRQSKQLDVNEALSSDSYSVIAVRVAVDLDKIGQGGDHDGKRPVVRPLSDVPALLRLAA